MKYSQKRNIPTLLKIKKTVLMNKAVDNENFFNFSKRIHFAWHNVAIEHIVKG